MNTKRTRNDKIDELKHKMFVGDIWGISDPFLQNGDNSNRSCDVTMNMHFQTLHQLYKTLFPTVPLDFSCTAISPLLCLSYRGLNSVILIIVKKKTACNFQN